MHMTYHPWLQNSIEILNWTDLEGVLVVDLTDEPLDNLVADRPKLCVVNATSEWMADNEGDLAMMFVGYASLVLSSDDTLTSIAFLDLGQLSDTEKEVLYKEHKKLQKTADLLLSDAVFLSFPKSGRTWVRWILAKYIQCLKPKATFSLEFMPCAEWNKYRTGVNFPGIFFTHNYLDYWQDNDLVTTPVQTEELSGKPIIFLHRNPLDVHVSYYHQKTSREKKFEGSLEDFAVDPQYGYHQQTAFMNSMLDLLEGRGDVLYLSYEALLGDPFREIHRMLSWLGHVPNNRALHLAVDASSLAQMQREEINANRRAARLETGFVNRIANSAWQGTVNELKARKGQAGSYREEMGDALADWSECQPDIVSLQERLDGLA